MIAINMWANASCLLNLHAVKNKMSPFAQGQDTQQSAEDNATVSKLIRHSLDGSPSYHRLQMEPDPLKAEIDELTAKSKLLTAVRAGLCPQLHHKAVQQKKTLFKMETVKPVKVILSLCWQD